MAALIPFFVAYYVSYLLRSVNAVMAPELERELGVGAAGLGFLTSTYFLSFAGAQLPVGLALDRFGPRRVVALLMTVATAGVLLFASARSFAGLAVGRALVGVGVSACLMGALKAAASGFAAERQASLTGLIMAAGALGALSASVPLERLLPVVGWRGAVLVVAGLCAVCVVLVGALVPATLSPQARQARWQDEIRALGLVLRSSAFWRFGPQAFFFTGGFMAVQGLWVVPWAMTTEGRSRAGAATLLLGLSLGMLAGQLAVGAAAGRLARAGWDRARLMSGGLLLALAVEAVIVAGVVRGPLPWFVFGLTSAVGAQVYGVAAEAFELRLSGRVSTALNTLAFAGAFLLQWGIGVSIDWLSAAGGDPVRAARITVAAVWLAQVLSVLAAGWSPPPRSSGPAASA